MHSNREWRALKSRPDDWAKAVAFDERIRSQVKYVSSKSDPQKSHLRGTPYVHSSRVPLKEANLYNQDERQFDLFDSDCGGMCGV